MIYFVSFHTTIRPKDMDILIDILIDLYTTIRPKIRVLIDLIFLFAHDYSTKLYGPVSFILSFCTTIRPKIRVLIVLFFLMHTTIWPNYIVLFHLFFHLWTIIRPKIRVVIYLLLSFAHDHSTKIYDPLSFILSSCTERPFDQKLWSSLTYIFLFRGHSYSII